MLQGLEGLQFLCIIGCMRELGFRGATVSGGGVWVWMLGCLGPGRRAESVEFGFPAIGVGPSDSLAVSGKFDACDWDITCWGLPRDLIGSYDVAPFWGLLRPLGFDVHLDVPKGTTLVTLDPKP